jgi:hypothetical protein
VIARSTRAMLFEHRASSRRDKTNRVAWNTTHREVLTFRHDDVSESERVVKKTIAATAGNARDDARAREH